ncbi:reverse transcriptase domain-containing protein [Tanacetum coccineum]|uniref:Reverse transcriptase domain-containing protein n=1 Tax=Tanacetum coccineum TaxID=301880 RepID=A0ABQ5B4U5_9ASTR
MLSPSNVLLPLDLLSFQFCYHLLFPVFHPSSSCFLPLITHTLAYALFCGNCSIPLWLIINPTALSTHDPIEDSLNTCKKEYDDGDVDFVQLCVMVQSYGKHLKRKKCSIYRQENPMFPGGSPGGNVDPDIPDKIDAFAKPPITKHGLKYVQKLNGKLASLNRFLAKSAEKSLPFFKTLKKCTKKSDFLWTEEAESAFKQMKELIAKLPKLIAPEEKEELIIYLAASKEAVSVVLMTEREAKQMPIYFVSRALRGPEVKKRTTTSMENLC